MKKKLWIVTGLFLVLFCTIAPIKGANGETVPQVELDRLHHQFDVLDTNPCASTLRFDKLLWSWYVSCPGCASVPAEKIYPKAMLDLADQWAVNDTITFARILELTGSCQ